MIVQDHEASYQENRVFEDNMFWLNGLSAVKGLQILKAMNINVMELNPPMTYVNPLLRKRNGQKKMNRVRRNFLGVILIFRVW